MEVLSDTWSLEQATWETARTLNHKKLEIGINFTLETFLCYDENYSQKNWSFSLHTEKEFFNLKSAQLQVYLEKTV